MVIWECHNGVAFNSRDMVGFKRDDLHRETERFLANGLIQRSEYNDVGLLSSHTSMQNMIIPPLSIKHTDIIGTIKTIC